MRLVFNIAYDGTNYSGWQIQPNASTIQQDIEDSLYRIYQQKISIVGCGRTDAGVHADDYFFHCDIPTDHIDCERLKFKLNRMLSYQISIKDIREAPHEFHARFDAKQRSYRYSIHYDKNPFIDRFSYHFPYGSKMDLATLNKVGAQLLNYTDFNTFCKTNSDVNTTICHIYSCKWEYSDSEGRLFFNIRADRYLRGMIRLIVGAHINILREKVQMNDLIDALNNKTQLKLNWSAPAQGLSLYKVEY